VSTADVDHKEKNCDRGDPTEEQAPSENTEEPISHPLVSIYFGNRFAEERPQKASSAYLASGEQQKSEDLIPHRRRIVVAEKSVESEHIQRTQTKRKKQHCS
jgi:hypothetical protein